MERKFIRQVEHVAKEPVSVVREHPDRLIIAGVEYEGDYFRTFGHPETDVLYAVRVDEDGCVYLTEIRDVDEAKKFFEETLTLPSPKVGEGIEGDDDAI